ncbi:MAG TPA: FAD-dependent oxidoreductase [Ramlibacter sp.]|nr:FAD-dependent oxidoreductase [Ramlibacter sp.]
MLAAAVALPLNGGGPLPEDIDLLVVGAGAGGMTAALVAALEGLRVVVCEASDQVGGTTATSAGTLWAPGNLHGASAGHTDSIDAAARYLEALIGPDDARGLRRAFLESAPEALEYLEARSAVKFASSGKHPDYLPLDGAAVAGRAVSPLPFDGRVLGRDFARIRPPIAPFMLLGGMMVGKTDIGALVRRFSAWPDFLHSARLVTRYAADRLRYPRGTRLVMGNALVARLYHSLREAGVELRFGWRLRDVHVRGGRAVGASFDTPQGPAHVTARTGVVLATGGVGHDARLRDELAPGGAAIASLACETVRGDGLRAARGAGAQLEQHRPANFFWQPVSVVPRRTGQDELFPHLFLDRAKPGLIAVGPDGGRFVNEAASYHHFVEGMLRAQATPAREKTWIVCDAQFIRRYGLGVIPPGTRRLSRWAERGYIACAPTLRELARAVGIEEAGLLATVSRSNGFAETGLDLDFAKGETELDRFNGDSTHGPNPCLGPLLRPPFCALEIRAADAASSAGLATDSDGQVLGDDGAPLAGLYACGNDAASVMRGAYPGPGTTLGPAMVFGWRIGRHAALRRIESSSRP